MDGDKKKPDGKPVWIKNDTAVELDSAREHPRDSYDDVIRKLIAFKRAHANCPGIPEEKAPTPAEVVPNAPAQ